MSLFNINPAGEELYLGYNTSFLDYNYDRREDDRIITIFPNNRGDRERQEKDREKHREKDREKHRERKDRHAGYHLYILPKITNFGLYHPLSYTTTSITNRISLYITIRW